MIRRLRAQRARGKRVPCPIPLRQAVGSGPIASAPASRLGAGDVQAARAAERQRVMDVQHAVPCAAARRLARRAARECAVRRRRDHAPVQGRILVVAVFDALLAAGRQRYGDRRAGSAGIGRRPGGSPARRWAAIPFSPLIDGILGGDVASPTRAGRRRPGGAGPPQRAAPSPCEASSNTTPSPAAATRALPACGRRESPRRLHVSATRGRRFASDHEGWRGRRRKRMQRGGAAAARRPPRAGRPWPKRGGRLRTGPESPDSGPSAGRRDTRRPRTAAAPRGGSGRVASRSATRPRSGCAR
ncbi:hypothetical protein X891_6025 [Burkholderia pseudomallei TSV 43]|nr:hypothetical protein X891_6025 [Burkholderia pseudomallei TSV 43]